MEPGAYSRVQLSMADVQNNSGAPGGDILRILLAILLPPVGVLLQVGLTAQFFINVLLTLLGYIPGVVHAVWIIARR